MTTYYPHKITLSDGQKVSLARAFGPGEAVTLRFKNEALTGGSDTLHLTARQIKKIQRAIKNKTGADIDLSKTQIRHIRKLARGVNPTEQVCGLNHPEEERVCESTRHHICALHRLLVLGATKKKPTFVDVPLTDYDLRQWCKYLKIPIKGIFARDEIQWGTPHPRKAIHLV